MNASKPCYRIGAVSRLTGVPVSTLRIWERRYRAVDPVRTSKGGRLYCDGDIRRITLLKAAVDAGFPIGTIYDLSDEALQQRLRQAPATTRGEGAVQAPLAVALVGPSLSAACAVSARLRIVTRRASLDELGRPPAGVDAVVIEVPALVPDVAERLAALAAPVPAPRLLVVYRFASTELLEQLAQAGVYPVRGPLDIGQLERVCLEHCGRVADKDVGVTSVSALPPPRRYSDTELARLLARSTSVQCQCPHHLVELLTALNAFEAYSLGCQSRDERDAALHGWLAQTSGCARNLLEQALERVLLHEGLTP